MALYSKKEAKLLVALFQNIGTVKRLRQRGFVLRNIPCPTTVGNHAFREVLVGWIIADTGKSGLNSDRIIKIGLVHDLVGGYAGDLTPYEPFIKKNKEHDLHEVFEKWIRLSKKDKERFYKNQRIEERKALKKLTRYLAPTLAQEISLLWKEYEQGTTNEGRFVQQLDMLENFFQATEYWINDHTFPIEPWWHQMKELITDTFLLEILTEMDKQFFEKHFVRKGAIRGG